MDRKMLFWQIFVAFAVPLIFRQPSDPIIQTVAYIAACLGAVAVCDYIERAARRR